MNTNNKQIFFIFLSFFFLTSIAFAQKPSHEADIQGIGFISPEIIYGDEVYDTTVQTKVIKLYNQNNEFSGKEVRWQRMTGHASDFFQAFGGR